MKKEVTFQGLTLPVNQSKGLYVPILDKGFLIKGVGDKTTKKIMAGVLKNKALLFVGPTGCGKTALVKYLSSLTNNSYKRIQITGSTDIEHLAGRQLLNDKGTYWVNGILAEAMKHGYWLLLDEINTALPEVMFIINSILDDDAKLILDLNNGEEIERHPNFRLFAAMNPSEDYAGTKEMNKAQKDRFQIVPFDYPSAQMEISILEARSGVSRKLGTVKTSNKGVLKRMVEFANILREGNIDQDILTVCSTRQLIDWIQLSDILTLKEAAEMSVIDRAEVEEVSKIKDELNKLFRDGETLDSNKKDDEQHLKFKEAKEVEDKAKAADERVKKLAEELLNNSNQSTAKETPAKETSEKLNVEETTEKLEREEVNSIPF